MKNKKIYASISLFGSICSILGIGIFTIFSNTNKEGESTSSVGLLVIILVIILGVLSSMYLWNKYKSMKTLQEGYEVESNLRGIKSQSFSKPTLRSIDIFAGDLSWLETDLTTYRDLIKRNVTVRILTDNSNSTAIPTGKIHGIKFAKYPSDMTAPLKASLYDTEDETESRALVVQKKSIKPNKNGKENYDYWFKEYYGDSDSKIIKGMKNYFDDLFKRGTKL